MLIRGAQTDNEWQAMMSRHLESLQQMVGSDGYKLLDAHMESMERDIKNKLLSVQNGDSAMRLVGELAVIENVRQYVPKTLMSYTRELRGSRK